jgi:NADH dehydrogenase
VANIMKRVVIVGTGFGGLSVANTLGKHKDLEILLIDRNNFHTFTPLLYQVATSALDPSEIAYPVRGIYRKRGNVRFLLGEVKAIDSHAKTITVKAQDEYHVQTYDYLVIAAGSVTNYFGSADLAQFAFGLKDLADSVTLRNHILKLFEKAEWTKYSALREALTTLVVVGGGPTGLETAGALYELYNHVLAKEYNRNNGVKARVVLVEALDYLLAPYSERLQRAALRQLEGLGVEVILGQRVTDVEAGKVTLSDGEVIYTHTLVWAAGVKGSPIAEALGVELGRGGRIPVEPTMQVKGLEQTYAIGDIAYLEDADGNPYAQVIQVAKQQGKLTAQNILRHMKGQSPAEFAYNDLGIMATIGRRRAVAWPFYKVQLTGYFAWLTWLGLHLVWLMGFRNRINVFVNWVWNYFTYDRSVRIILEKPYAERDAQRLAEVDPVITRQSESEFIGD